MSAFTRKNVFVNPFYHEGVGRRTGIVLNKDVRKDSDGFEVFDDYWSESENDATVNATYAAEKENTVTKPTSWRKKSSLKSMSAFSPPVTSSEREESKVGPPQEVSQAAEDVSAFEADLTGSIIKGPPTGLEPSSALLKFKTRQRLSFSEATNSEESQSTEEDGSVGDEGGGQESGTSSEGTVKAPSSQSELSQEGDSQAETEDEDVDKRGSEKQSSQTTSEPSSQEEEVLEPEAHSASQEGAAQTRESKRRSNRGKPAEAVLEPEAPSSSQEGAAQIRESKRRSTRGKPAEAKLQDETTRLHGNQEANVPKEKGSRKSTSQTKNVEKEEMIEKEVEGEKGAAVETRRRKSTRQSNSMKINAEVEKDVDKETEKDTEIGRRKSSRQSNISVQNEKKLEKDIAGKAKKGIDTRRRKSARQSGRGEKNEEEEKVEVDVKSRRSRSTRLSNRVEDIKDDVKEETEDAKSTRRRSKQQTNVSAGKEFEVEKDEITEDRVAEETEGEMVGGTKGDEVSESVTETEEEAEEAEKGETETETGGEVREPEQEQTDVGAESEEAVEKEAEKIGKTEENVKEAITQKDKMVVACKSNVIADEEDDDTEGRFLSLRMSMAVPSVANLEDEFDVADAHSQEFGMVEDNQKLNLKKVERTNGLPIDKGKDKGGKKRDVKESREDDEPKALSKSTRRPTQKGKQENEKGKGQKKREMKRGSEIHRDDDHKRSKESPKENAYVDKDDSKPATRGKRSRGKKPNKQKDRLQTSQRSSGSASQGSSSDTDADAQLDDDQADAMQDHQKYRRKQGQKKTPNHPAKTSKTGKNSEKTVGDRTLEIDEDSHSTGKGGSSSHAIRSRQGRKSSVHFTTKDMISVSGDISIHQVTCSEEDVENHKKAVPTPAALSKDKKKSRRPCTGAKTQDKLTEDAGNVEEHWSGQSKSDSTAESEEETAVQGRRMRGGKKTKKSSKRRSTEATSTTSVAETEVASGVKKKRVNRREQETKSASESQSDASDGYADDHTAHVSMDSQDISHSPATDRSTSGRTPVESPHTSSSGHQEGRSVSTGSILKGSKGWSDKCQNKGKKYSILFTEIPLQKAFIIKPDQEDGVRRTRRQRVRPLEYWRNERPIYERRKSGGFALAGILSPEQAEKSVPGKSMRQPAKPKGHLPVTPTNISIHATPPVGTSTVCQPTINVVNPDSDQEVAIDAVATSKMLKFTGPSGLPAKPEDPITISKALSQKAFSAGVLTVRPFEEKGSQLVRHDTMIFNVVRGKIAMTLHETSQILQNGDWFFVPKGNVYNIKNLRKDEAKLTFFQLKST